MTSPGANGIAARRAPRSGEQREPRGDRERKHGEFRLQHAEPGPKRDGELDVAEPHRRRRNEVEDEQRHGHHGHARRDGREQVDPIVDQQNGDQRRHERDCDEQVRNAVRTPIGGGAAAAGTSIMPANAGWNSGVVMCVSR